MTAFVDHILEALILSESSPAAVKSLASLLCRKHMMVLIVVLFIRIQQVSGLLAALLLSCAIVFKEVVGGGVLRFCKGGDVLVVHQGGEFNRLGLRGYLLRRSLISALTAPCFHLKYRLIIVRLAC